MVNGNRLFICTAAELDATCAAMAGPGLQVRELGRDGQAVKAPAPRGPARLELTFTVRERPCPVGEHRVQVQLPPGYTRWGVAIGQVEATLKVRKVLPLGQHQLEVELPADVRGPEGTR